MRSGARRAVRRAAAARAVTLAFLIATCGMHGLAACARAAAPEPTAAAVADSPAPSTSSDARGDGRARAETVAALAVTLRPQTSHPGGIAVVVIDDPALDPGRVSLRLAGQEPVAFFAGADRRPRALLGVDLATAPGKYPIVVEVVSDGPGAASAPARTRLTLTVERRDFPREDLRVEGKYVEPDASTQGRIRKEQARIDGVLADPVRRRLWQGDFLIPADGPLGSPFGLRRFFNGQERRSHGGQDLRVAEGTPVVAAQTGKVVLADEHFFSGKTVVLDHGHGLFTFYFHLSSFRVVEGDLVERGAQLGNSGKTGRVTGPHLHWAARLNGARIDPLLLIKDPAAEGTSHAKEHRD